HIFFAEIFRRGGCVASYVGTCTPRPLAKLEHDLGRMESDPTDAYAAFDFFVTAEHLLDWLHPDRANGKADREKLRNQYEIIQIVSHLACGAKHFDGLRNYHRPLTASLFR